MSSIYFSFFLFLSLTTWLLSWRFISKEARIISLIYSLFYVGTTLIGATIIGLTDGNILDRFQLTWGLNVDLIKSTDTFKYWCILYAPLIILPITLLQFKAQKHTNQESTIARSHRVKKINFKVDILTYSISLLFFTAFCFLKMYASGYLTNLANWRILEGDYQSLIQARIDTIYAVGASFYGVTYMSLPALSHIALYQVAKARGNKIVWCILFFLSFCIIALLSLSILQKAAVIIYGLSILIGFIFLNFIKRWMLPFILPIVGWFTFSFLNFLQSFMAREWDSLQGFFLIILRTASSFPFYINLYPEVLPYSGIDIGLDIIGLDKYPIDNLIVFDYMYPSVIWTQGAVAAAAHVRAYAQGGIIYAMVTLVLIGFFIKILAQLGKRLSKQPNPILYALYIQGGIIFLYYISQGAIRDALLVSYGVKWVFIGLMTVVIFQMVCSGFKTDMAQK